MRGFFQLINALFVDCFRCHIISSTNCWRMLNVVGGEDCIVKVKYYSHHQGDNVLSAIWWLPPWRLYIVVYFFRVASIYFITRLRILHVATLFVSNNSVRNWLVGWGRLGAPGPQVFPVPVFQKCMLSGLEANIGFILFYFYCVSFELYSVEFYSVCIVSIIDSRVRRRSILCYYVGCCCDNVHLMRRCRWGNSGGPCTHVVDGGADITQ